MFLKAFHHVAIIASNYQQSKVFYTHIPGLRIIAENFRENRNSYKLDLALPNGNQIELFSFDSPPKRLTSPEACGLRHLAFSVDCLNDSVTWLEKNGVAVEAIRIDEFTGKAFTFFKDPDGLPLELYES